MDIQFQCDQCDKIFSNKRNLSQHFETHTAEKNTNVMSVIRYFHETVILKDIIRYTQVKSVVSETKYFLKVMI